MAEPKPTMLDPEDDNLDYKEVDFEEEVENAQPVEIEEGALFEGEVVQVEDDHALVDIGAKSEGILPFDRLHRGSISEEDLKLVKVIEREHEGEAPLLSEKEAVADKMWNEIEQACSKENSIEGTIFKKIKGGFLVEIFDELTAFMPLSHLSINRKSNLDKYIDKSFEMKVLEFDREEANVVVSRREHLEEKRRAEQDEFFGNREVGEWVEGTVKNIVNFGAFINLGPVDGLLHKSDVAWGAVRNVEDYLTLGEKVEVKILDMDQEESKVSLGLKQKYSDPWEDIEGKYEVGEVTTGEIVDVWSDGVFVRLERDVEGKVPEEELAWTKTWQHPEDQFKEGEKMEVKIMGIDPERRHVDLSRKQTGSNPWEILQKRFPEGTVLSAPVVDITKKFINVQLLENVKGRIKKSNINWENDEVNLFDRFSIGQKVKCKVLKLNSREQIVELGIKQMLPDPWVKKARQYPPGTTVEGTVTSILQFGAFVRLEKGLEGLVHVSEMSEGKKVNPFEEVAEGEEVGVKVLSIDEEERKIDLSIQGYREEQQREQMEEYMKDSDQSSGGEMTFGDLVGEDLNNLMEG
ncbi:MAG: S1 RNA-binding domain-containing protein [bacterium]